MVASIVKSLWRNDEGAALVEGAVLMPLLLVLMLGVYEFSWFFFQQHVIADGLKSAARHLARSPDACNAASPRWTNDETVARRLAATGSVTNSRLRIKGWSPNMIAISCTAVENPMGPEGLRMYRGNAVVFVVTASSRFTAPSLGFFGFFGLKPLIISASHSERVIGPG